VRIVIDTNIIISGLMVVPSLPARILDLWWEKELRLITCEEQVSEIREVTRRPHIKPRVRPALARKFVNAMRKSAIFLDGLAEIDVSPDPFDNYLLALAQAGEADFLVTGDKDDLLEFERFGATHIVTARQFLENL